MKISRQLTISRRIITRDDLIRLARIFSDESSANLSASRQLRLSFTVRADDGTIFETSDISDLFSDDVLKTKRIASFDLSFSDYSRDLSMHLSLSQGASDYRNSISVQGSDANWVTGSFTRLKESVEACAPQTSFLLRYRVPIELVSAVGIGRLYTWVLDILLSLIIPSSVVLNPPEWIASLRPFFRAHPSLLVLLDYVIGLPLGWFAALLLLERAVNLWPSVEFQIGPPHTYVEKRRRILLSTIFVVGILPLITLVIYDLLKSLP